MDLGDVAALRSGSDSAILDRDGDVVGRFSLMEPLDGQRGAVDDVVRGVLAVSEPTRFERPRGAAPSVLSSIWRVAHGLPPRASGIAVELADALLPPSDGARRAAVRRDLLATRIDAATTVEARVGVWVDWVPLCRGRRGVERAAADCLGVRGPRAIEAAAVIAAAARWRLDLSDDRPLLAARRDAVLDALLREGAIGADSLLDVGPLPDPPPLPDGAAAFLDLAASAARRARDRHDDPMQVETTLDEALRGRLVDRGADAFLIVDPRDGAILAGAGDPDRPRLGASLAELAQLDAGDVGSARDLVEPLERPSLRRAVSLLAALAAEGELRPPVLVRAVRSARGHDPVEPPDPARLCGPEAAFRRLIRLPERGGARAARIGDLLLVAHPDRVGAFWSPVDDAAAVEAVVDGLRPRRFATPDGLALQVVDGQSRAVPRAQSATQRTPGPGAQRSAIGGTSANGEK